MDNEAETEINEIQSIKDSIDVSDIPFIQAENPRGLELDPAGYFKIAQDMERMLILAKHYSYNKELLRVIEGTDAESICQTIIKYQWASTLKHAAYLGQELAKAEIAMKSGVEYVQG